jgi:polyisoprenoid-binding protein YceI
MWRGRYGVFAIIQDMTRIISKKSGGFDEKRIGTPIALIISMKSISRRRKFMKRMTQMKIAAMAVLVLATASVRADDSSQAGGGNKLQQNQTHWYQAAAETVGPVDGITTEKGTLLTLQTGSFLYMEGDSTLHKYQMTAHALTGSAVVKGSSTDLFKALKAGKVGAMSLVVPIASFKSRESGLDDNAAKALKATDNPVIRFDLTKEKLADGATDGTYVLTATGTLTIAGDTEPITLTADATVTDNQIHLKGVQPLKMSDFKITPPSISLVVTAITCTDAIEVHYDVIFAAK